MNIAELVNPNWARIGKSTIFDLVLNAQTETNDFIEDEMATDDVTSYKPELSQELQANKGDPAFDYLYDMFYNLPTGEDVKKNLLIIFAGNIGTEEAPMFRAWNTTSTLILDHFDSVAEKIYFKFSISKYDKVTCSVANGVPIFVNTDTTVPDSTVPDDTVSDGATENEAVTDGISGDVTENETENDMLEDDTE